MRFAVLIAAMLSAVTSAPAAPPVEEPIGYTGTLLETADESVTLKLDDGSTKTVAMRRGWYVATLRPVPAEAIELGSFIGSANTPIDDETGRAVELRIFEAGHRPDADTHPMGGRPTFMTHGTVTRIEVTAQGRELEVSYPSGKRRIILPTDVQVRQGLILDPMQARPGAVVTAVTRKGEDGVWRATRLLVTESNQ